MVSLIDATKPADGVPALKSDLRAALAAAKGEIETEQGNTTALSAAIGIALGVSAIPDLEGNFTPEGAATIIEILLALDAAIAANVGGGGGATELGDLSDILTPSTTIRRAFNAGVSATPPNTNFNFDLATHGGATFSFDNSANTVQMLLPATSALSARSDGWLCTVMPQSGLFAASIAGPADSLRYQADTFGVLATATEVFLGKSTARAIRSVIEVYKDGPVYILRGSARFVVGDDLTRNAPGSVLGSALETGGLPVGFFPSTFTLGGTKAVGGGKRIIRSVGGTTTLVAGDSGNIVLHTGSSPVNWNVADLEDGIEINLDNDGTGAVTINPTGSKTITKGGSVLAAGTFGSILFRNGDIRTFGLVAP